LSDFTVATSNAGGESWDALAAVVRPKPIAPRIAAVLELQPLWRDACTLFFYRNDKALSSDKRQEGRRSTDGGRYVAFPSITRIYSDIEHH
jgi:hypothetical protein